MQKRTIPVSDFDLPRFINTIVDFWGDQEIAFPLVENGFADFGAGCLEDAEGAGNTPHEWLQNGMILFGQFTRRNDGLYELADETVIDVPDDDETEFVDECSTFGFLIQLRGDILNIETAILNDVTGECVIKLVDNVGIFESCMARFIDSMYSPSK